MNRRESPKRNMGRLHVIVGPTVDDPALELTKQVLDAGAPVVQIRVKGTDDATALGLIEPIVALCLEYGATSIVNDRADLCVAAGADGVHGGASDLSVTARRRVVGPERLVGATARDAGQVSAAADAGADYVGVGPVFATSTKAGLPEPVGLDGLASAAGATSSAVPVIAIAGITVERVDDVLGAGAHGVAVVSAITQASDPAAATRAFLRRLDR